MSALSPSPSRTPEPLSDWSTTDEWQAENDEGSPVQVSADGKQFMAEMF